jgi:bacillopeptidase F
VTWIGYRSSISGIADVYLDGTFVTTLDLYSPTEAIRVPVFTRSGLTAGQHTLRIDVTGQKNPSALGSYVAVDAFDVTLLSPGPPVARFQQTPPTVIYTPAGDWGQSTPDKFDSGRTVAFSTAAMAQAEFTFTGTSIRVLGHRRRDTGIVRVFLDGALVGDVDTFASLQDEFQGVIFSRTGLTPGQHRVTLVVTGQTNPSSAGVLIVLDAFDVY